MQVSPRQYRVVAVGALIALAIIVVTGAAVRLTNSGLGCDDWPRCSSTKLIDVSSKHAAIEQINRLFTGVVGVAVIAAVLASMFRVPRRRDLTILSWGLVAGVVGNAVLGGISVKYDLHPMLIQGHLLLSMALIVTGTVLVRRAGEEDDAIRVPAVSRPSERLTWLLFGVIVIAVFTGTIVTGAGPHAGDEDAERLDVAIPTVARIHGTTVTIALAVALLIAWRIRSHPGDRAALANVMSTWIFVGALQAAVGYIQYFNEVPAALVGIHVAGATLIMFVTTRVVLDTRIVRPAVI
jgi:cytochrome c oxidase assembly protein subunit 15